ncbi:MAG: Gfo/Idh/MocA family oxidoreductase [Burkholderiales bacterium]|nr:Gfo/Idh/MocA family oxidoreductase [Burkholderiales bacterium]
MNNTIGWGFIGASTIAREHMVAAVRAQIGHEVVAVASSSMERAIAFSQELQIARPYDSVQALLADPNVKAIYISTTNDLHCEQLMAAASAGKHVLCEKPLALSLTDGQRMVAACRNAGVVMATNHHLRNAATHRKLRKLVQSGAVGQPLFARVFHAVYLRPVVQRWRIDKPQAGGGAILDIVVHDADALRFIFGANPIEAIGMSQTGFLAREGLEDGAMAVLRLDNGVLAQIHAAFTVRHAGTGMEIHGDTGSIVARDVMSQRAVGEIVLRDEHGERLIPVEHENLYARGVASFCAAMRGEGSPAASGEDGVHSLAAALAVVEACRTRTAVKIHPGLPM